jgi:hypothetical protein
MMSISHGQELVQQMIFDGQPTTTLAAACRQLVSTKYRIDDWLDARHRLFRARGWGRGLTSIVSDIDDWFQYIAQNQAVDDEHRAVDDELWLAERYPGPVRGLPRESDLFALKSYDFLEHVLPGVRTDIYKESDGVLRDVDSSLVIGGTSRPYNSEAASWEDLDRINAEGDALYAKVGSLPLYYAIEGKNRVRAFQLKRRSISAFTCSCCFPRADALELHEVVGSGIYAVSSTKFGGLQPLILPSVTVPLLTSYGVRWGRRQSRGVTGRGARKFEHDRRKALYYLASSWPQGDWLLG